MVAQPVNMIKTTELYAITWWNLWYSHFLKKNKKAPWCACSVSSPCLYFLHVSFWLSTAMPILTCCTEPFADRATAGEVAVVMTPPATLSIVVPGFESCEVAGTDFKELSDIFIRDACPPWAACRNKVGRSNDVAFVHRHNLFLIYIWDIP